MPLDEGKMTGLHGVLQEGGKYLLNNHLRFNILFHRDVETDLARIVGFEVDGVHGSALSNHNSLVPPPINSPDNASTLRMPLG